MKIVICKDGWTLVPIVWVQSESGRRYILTQTDNTWGTTLFETLWRRQK